MVTVTLYVFMPVALAICTDTRFSPSAQVAALPFVMLFPFTVITISVPASAVAVIVFVAFVVSVVYSFTSASNVGSRVRDPRASAESFGVPSSEVTFG